MINEDVYEYPSLFVGFPKGDDPTLGYLPTYWWEDWTDERLQQVYAFLWILCYAILVYLGRNE